jgi:hypothetical protein
VALSAIFLVCLRSWAAMREAGFHPLQVLLHGPYTEGIRGNCQHGEVREMPRGLKRNGVHLANLQQLITHRPFLSYIF